MKLLYFAWLRERMGRSEEDVDRPAGVNTVGELAMWLQSRDAAGGTAFAQPGVVRAAVNQAFATPHTPIQDADEVAFFPPVTGG